MAIALDAHAKPPDSIRQIYKHFQKLNPRAVAQDDSVIDIQLLNESHPHLSPTSLLQLPTNIRETFTNFVGGQITATEEPKVYSVNARYQVSLPISTLAAKDVI